jgi:hypothetical protein
MTDPTQEISHGASREMAVRFAVSVLRRAEDWQDAQHALADHDIFGPWLERTYGEDVLSAVQSIIGEAEGRL